METLSKLHLRLPHCRRMLADSLCPAARDYWRREVLECEYEMELMAVVPGKREGA